MELESVKRISLDINNNKNVTVQSVQYDNNFKTLIINITEDGKPYIVDSTNIKAILKCTKPDGTYVVRDCNILENGSLSVVIDGQILIAYGIVKSEIALMEIETDVIAHTMPFKIFVSQSVCDDEQVTSSSEFNAFEKTMIGYVDQAKKVAEETAKEVSPALVEEFKAAVKDDMEISKQCALDSEQYANQSLEYKNEAGEYVKTVQSAVTVVTEFSNTASTAANNALLSENNSQKYMNSAKSSSDNAKLSEDNALASEQKAKASETVVKTSEENVISLEANVLSYKELAENASAIATEKAEEIVQYNGIAKSYAVGTDGVIREDDASDNAKYYQSLAKTYSENSEVSKNAAKISEDNAKVSEENSKISETNSSISEVNAKDSETNAKISEDNAKVSETNAKESETKAKTSEDNAKSYMDTTLLSEQNAETLSNLTKSYAVGTNGEVREGDSSDNAKYYYEQTKGISQSLSGVLKPMGTIVFDNLPLSPNSGDMYNISNEFITDDRFKEGTGKTMPIGTNVYFTEDGYWDCLAGSPVTGIKGSNETSYRQGNVEITPDNLGLHSVATSGSYTDLSDKPTIPSVGNGTITITQNGTTKGTFTTNQGGNTTIELTDNNTTYGVATSSALGLVKSGTDITVDSSGNVSVNDDSHNHVISNVDGLQSALDGKSSTGHTHNYAGSSSAGGSANSLSYFKNTSNVNIGIDDTSANAIGYVSGASSILNQNDGAMYKQVYSNLWAHEIYGDYITGQIAVRSKNNGTWQEWRKILDSSNYTSYCTPANIGAAASSHTHSYLPLSGGTMTGTIISSKTTNTYLAGNQGATIINSTASAGSYTMLAKMNSTNGYFTTGSYRTEYVLQYTAKTTVDASTNSVTKAVKLLDESGNSSFPGTVTASTFSGALSGNASTATALTTSAGSATQPVYFSDGKPVACTYTLGKSVPSDAVFTDTNTWRPVTDNLTSTSTSNCLSANQGRVLKGLIDSKSTIGDAYISCVKRITSGSEVTITVPHGNNTYTVALLDDLNITQCAVAYTDSVLNIHKTPSALGASWSSSHPGADSSVSISSSSSSYTITISYSNGFSESSTFLVIRYCPGLTTITVS